MITTLPVLKDMCRTRSGPQNFVSWKGTLQNASQAARERSSCSLTQARSGKRQLRQCNSVACGSGILTPNFPGSCLFPSHSHRLMNAKRLERCLARCTSLCYGVSTGFFAFSVRSGKWAHEHRGVWPERRNVPQTIPAASPELLCRVLQGLGGWVGGGNAWKY